MSDDDELRGLLEEAAGDPGQPDLASLTATMRRRRRRRQVRTRGTAAVAVLAAGTLVLTGGLGRVSASGPSRLKLAADLTAYSSCDSLLADLQARAVPLIGPYGYAGSADGQTSSGPQAAFSSLNGLVAPAAAEASAAEAPLAHSSTTDRTRGVDEPDITKTDGRLFLSLRNGVLRVYDAVHPALLGSLTLGDSSTANTSGYAEPVPSPGLLLTGTRAVVTGLQPLVTRAGDTRGTTTTDVVDLSNPAHPSISRQLSIDGDLIDARLVDGLPRLVVHAAPPTLRWFSPVDGTAAAQAEAKDRNLALLRASTIADWLPTYALSDGAGRDLGHGRLFDCGAVERDTAPSDGADLVGVTSFDPTATTAPTGGLAVVGAGNTAYVAGEHLWIATGRHGGGFFGGVTCNGGTFCPASASGAGSPSTQLHGFDLSDPAHTTEIGSTTVSGSLHGDDALNEAGGVLSVLLSSGGPEPGQSRQQTTLLDFRLGTGTLTQVGMLGDLGSGETLQSARWIGSFAYLVTFRQVDPLLVVDLSDPAAPKLRASLPSAATSTYLLQSDTGRLLGVGNAGNGSELKLYGVEDPDHPTLLATTTIAGGGSAAGSDPHTLLYWRAGRLLFLPSYNGKVSVTTIGRDTLTPAFTLSQAAHPGRASDQITRAVLIGHNAWTVSDRGVLVSDLAGGAEVAWLPS